MLVTHNVNCNNAALCCVGQVKNLDTGTEMDLATAEEHLPQSINPLSLHIMRLTSEYTGDDIKCRIWRQI